MQEVMLRERRSCGPLPGLLRKSLLRSSPLAQQIAKEPDGSRDVQPISLTSGPMLAEEPPGCVNETIGCAGLGLA
jgi:hypothetical protein